MSEPKQQVPWSPRDVLFAVLLLLPVMLVVTFLLYYLSLFILNSFLFLPAPRALWSFIVGFASFVTNIGLVWFFGVRLHRATASDLGLNGIKIWLDLPLAVVGEIIALIGLAAYSIFLSRVLQMQVPKQIGVGEFGSSTVGFIVAFVVIVVFAPIGEELLFRGFIYPAFRSRWGVGWGMVLTSGIFALFHVLPLLFVPMFIIGMVLVVLYEYRGTLAPNIMLHAINNLLALLTVYGFIK